MICFSCDSPATHPVLNPSWCQECYETEKLPALDDYIENLQYHDDLTEVTEQFRLMEADPGRY